VNDLGDRGSIVAYSHFEADCFKWLAEAVPELAERLRACIGRIIDLEKILATGYCHPDFGGRTSIKKTLPVMAPDLSYDTLAIGDGQTASAAFARVVLGETTPEERQQTLKDLREYCGQDTLAMIRVHQGLLKACISGS
jgi:hypothetical protein